MEKQIKIVSLRLPEYTIDSQPDYKSLGQKIDRVIEENFEGNFLERSLSMIDHPQLTLDQFVDIILKTGTDKYDPDRKAVAHEQFEPYLVDLQAGDISIRNGKLAEPFGENLLRLFYENTLLDRGYRLRIDLIVLYDPGQMIRAEKVDSSKPSVDMHLENLLWRFRDPTNKQKAVMGIVKILY